MNAIKNLFAKLREFFSGVKVEVKSDFSDVDQRREALKEKLTQEHHEEKAPAPVQVEPMPAQFPYPKATEEVPAQEPVVPEPVKPAAKKPVAKKAKVKAEPKVAEQKAPKERKKRASKKKPAAK